jgi:outer membrane protein assembly factor BamB
LVTLAGVGLGVGLGLAYGTSSGGGATACKIVPGTNPEAGAPAAHGQPTYTWHGRGAVRLHAVWSASLPVSFQASPVLAGRTVAVVGYPTSTAPGFVSGYDVGTGSLRWRQPLDSAWTREDVVGDTIVVTGLAPVTSGSSVGIWSVRLDAGTGRILSCRWLADYREQGGSANDVADWESLAIGARQVVFAGNAGDDPTGAAETTTLVVSDRRSGDVVRRRRLRGLWEALAVEGSHIVLSRSGSVQSYEQTRKGELATYDVRTGRLVSKGDTAPPYTSLSTLAFPLGGDEIVADGSNSKPVAMRAYDVTTGRPRWSVPTAALPRSERGRDGWPNVAPILLADSTLLATAGKHLVGFAAATGTRRWTGATLPVAAARFEPLGDLVVAHLWSPDGFGAYSLRDGHQVWRAKVAVGWESEGGPMLHAGGALVVPGRTAGTLIVLDARGLAGRTSAAGPVVDGGDPGMATRGALVAVAADRRLVLYRLR